MLDLFILAAVALFVLGVALGYWFWGLVAAILLIILGVTWIETTYGEGPF